MNGWCSLIYKNGCELPTFAYCIHLTFGAESMAAPTTYGTSRGCNRTVWRPMRDTSVVPEPQGQGKVAILVAK